MIGLNARRVIFVLASFLLHSQAFCPEVSSEWRSSSISFVSRHGQPKSAMCSSASVRGKHETSIKMVTSDISRASTIKSDLERSMSSVVAPIDSRKLEFLPWTESVAGPEHPLIYMPFMNYSLKLLLSELDLEPLPMDRDLALKYSENPKNPGRIVSLNFNSTFLRKARLTYFDAGSAVQVFNIVLYPDPSLDVPIFGADLISFNQKHLAGVDFQPLYSDPIYIEKYISKLAVIKNKYPEFSQKMSARFYDSARFFSENMLFSRFEEDAMIGQKLFPAFSEYLMTYLSTLKSSHRIKNGSFRKSILDRHAAYDQYNAERDPAHGLFNKYFGNKWSDRFIDEFLFELSVRPKEGYPRKHQ